MPDISALIKAAQQRPSSVPFNATWQKIFDELSVGSVKGNRLLLNFRDHERIQSYLKNVQGFTEELHSLELKKTRLERSVQCANEKAGTQGVFETRILAALSVDYFEHVHSLPFNNIHDVTFSFDKLTDLNTASIERVIVIENGTLLHHASLLSKALKAFKTLFVYRGHGNNVNSVRTLLTKLPADIELSYFFDYDPEGIQLVDELLNLRMGGIIVPDVADPKKHDRFNKLEAFKAQSDRLLNYQFRHAISSELFGKIMRQRLALTQEYLLMTHRSTDVTPVAFKLVKGI